MAVCPVCTYALQDGACRNPACGGTPEAVAAHAAAREEHAAERARRDKAAALRKLSFAPRTPSTFTPGPRKPYQPAARPLRAHVPQSAREPYYKLATWVPRLGTFRDGRGAYPSEASAFNVARKRPGRYRISRVTPDGNRHDYTPFEVR